MPLKFPAFPIERLRELLDYDPETGVLRWKVTRGPRLAGSVAGTRTIDGYLALGVAKTPMRAHRVAWALAHGAWPSDNIDHINGVRTDNRLANLRVAPQLENTQNRRRANRGTKSGLLGASWKSKIQRWVAQIRVDGKLRHLGYFQTAEAAHTAYLDAKRRHHDGCTI